MDSPPLSARERETPTVLFIGSERRAAVVRQLLAGTSLRDWRLVAAETALGATDPGGMVALVDLADGPQPPPDFDRLGAALPNTPWIALTRVPDARVPPGVEAVCLEQSGAELLASALRFALERHQLEQALWASEARFRAIREALPVGVIGFAPSGYCEYVNKHFTRLTGLTGPAALAQGWLRVFSPAERGRLEQAWQAYRQRPAGWFEHEGPLDPRDDARIWCSLRVAPVHSAEGRVCFIGFLTDITELRERRDELDEVMSGARCVLWTAQVQGYGDRLGWVLSIANPDTAQELLGFRLQPGQAHGQAWSACFSTDQMERMNDRSARALRGGLAGYVQEMQFHAPGGAPRWIREEVRIRQIGQQRWKVIGVCTDITEPRRTQEALLNAQKLESLGVLAGGIAHRFNNLLTAILGNAILARGQVGEDSPVDESLLEIERATQTAADLAAQMLAYSGKSSFQMHRYAVNELVVQVLALLQFSLPANIALSTDLATGLPEAALDPAHLHQALMNLIVNATEAIGDAGGSICVSTGLVDVDQRYLRATALQPPLPEGEYVYIKVADTGCGMDAEAIARLFDPFFTTKLAGRGLGLAAVLGIVHAHRGGITVESQPGAGATMCLLLPAA